MISKENSNQVRTLILLEEISFAKLANWPNKNNLFVVVWSNNELGDASG